MHSESTFIRKEPCPKCGSRDNLARYSDGHAHCFGCDHYEHGDGPVSNSERPKVSKDVLYEGDFAALKARKLTEETCRKFGYKVSKSRGGIQIAPYYSIEDGDLCGTKVRPRNKDDMFSTGDMGKVKLFGQQLWSEGGKKVVVTEGEIDAMSVSQVQGNRWPVVSVPKGAKAAAKDIANNLKWLASFDEVILMFDMDDPGRAAAAECAVLFPPGKCKVATLSMKDPNELLVADRGEEIVQAIWQAQPYRPDGVVRVSDLREEVLTPPTMGLAWFSDELTKLTYGRRYGETYAFGAGTGIGKTDWLTQQIMFDVTELGQRVALFMLEQKPAQTVKRVLGKFSGKAFHVPDGSWTQDELVTALDELERNDRVLLYDSFGHAEWETVESTIRFLAHSEGIRIFYLDHLTALADPENEKESLEKIMKAMSMLAVELDIIIHFVSHLSTPEGKPHEEGGRVMIKHFKGSRSIGFWSHFMFGLERDQQHEDERWQSITIFRVLKDRNTGRATGKLVHFDYDPTKGLLFETQPPEPEGQGGFKDETTNPDF